MGKTLIQMKTNSKVIDFVAFVHLQKLIKRRRMQRVLNYLGKSRNVWN